MKLIVAPEAQEQLREIESYIAEDNPKAAVEFVGRLTERYQALIDFPGMGRKRTTSEPDIDVWQRVIT